MLKINIFVRLKLFGSSPDDFNVENFIKEIKEDGLQRYIMEGSYPLGININGKDVLGKVASYPFHDNLKSLNNLFYNVIKSGDGVENKINFMAGLGAPENFLSIVKKDNKILLSGNKGISFVTNFSEWVELDQAVEEMVRVVKEYKDICERAANILEPDNVDLFLKHLFIDPSWNHDPWYNLEKAWEEYNSNLFI